MRQVAEKHMCEFLSINVRTDGAISHVASNSHSAAVQAAGWLENTDGKHVYDSFEWDGIGEFDLARICHDGAEPDRLTDAQIVSVKRIYGALQKVIAGNITEIMHGGVLHGNEWWDVYLAALDCDAVSSADKDKIRKELMVCTAGDMGTATAGNRGTATAGYRGTATAGNMGTATAGDMGTATAGDMGMATAGNRGTATSGNCGTSTSGDGGTIIIEYYDEAKSAWRKKIGEVTVNGKIRAGVAYKLNDKHEFVKA